MRCGGAKIRRGRVNTTTGECEMLNSLTLVRENTFEIMAACPFCQVGGATLNVFRNENMGSPVRRYFVSCDNCGASGSIGVSEDNAIALWNAALRSAQTRT